MKRIFILATTLCTTLAHAGGDPELPGVLAGPLTNPANGHIYFLLQSGTWTDSQASARALGGNLVTINNEEENDWVFDTFSGFGKGGVALWIGLTDQAREGRFKWISRDPSPYRNWAPGEPNNGGHKPELNAPDAKSIIVTNEDYAYMIPGSGGVDKGASKGIPSTAGQWADITNEGLGVGAPLHGVVEITPPRPGPGPGRPLRSFWPNHPSNLRRGWQQSLDIK